MSGQQQQQLAAKQREQRIVLGIGLVVAGLPILIQVLMMAALSLHSQAFPTADKGLTDAHFWPVQVVLLCVAVAGNAAVDFIRVMRQNRPLGGAALTQFLLLLLFFVCVSIMFAVSLLDSQIGWLWLIAMVVVGMGNLFEAYLLEMELATFM